MYIILFTDDIVFLTTNPVQSQIDKNNSFFRKIGSSIKPNLIKPKYLLLKISRPNDVNIDLYIYGEKIEQVDNFTYLGINFMYTGNMTHAGAT
jgi:hypothetical protein